MPLPVGARAGAVCCWGADPPLGGGAATQPQRAPHPSLPPAAASGSGGGAVPAARLRPGRQRARAAPPLYGNHRDPRRWRINTGTAAAVAPWGAWPRWCWITAPTPPRSATATPTSGQPRRRHCACALGAARPRPLCCGAGVAAEGGWGRGRPPAAPGSPRPAVGSRRPRDGTGRGRLRRVSRIRAPLSQRHPQLPVQVEDGALENLHGEPAG